MSVGRGDMPDEKVISRAAVAFSEVFPVQGATVGPQHFQKLKLLGRGGIGKVYLVLLKGTDKVYAMKVLTKEEMIAKNKVKRVMTEREILATTNHPFIATMYASFQTESRLCFVMEYCAGGEFFRVLQRQPKRRLKEDAARFYAAEVLLALEYLHYLGFIYRDLKPENILMRGTGHIALTDFDLSKQAQVLEPSVPKGNKRFSLKTLLNRGVSSESNLAKLNIIEQDNNVLSTESNSFVGTEEYIAPEVISGTSQTNAVDWWTFGVLLYEMISGCTPFKGANLDETLQNIMTEPLKWPEDVDASPECKKIVKKLLSREADKRLGAGQTGAQEIRQHKFFKDIQFSLIRNESPPMVPPVKDPLDMSQYGPLKEDDEDVALDESKMTATQNPFGNFSIRRDSEIVNRQY